MFYILHGNDSFTRSEELAILISKMGDADLAELNTVRLDGQTLSWDELLQHCMTVPFLSDRRLVIVSNLLVRLAQGRSKAEAFMLENLLAYLPDLPDTTRLVFVEDQELPNKHPLLILARDSNQGFEKAFTVPGGNELTRWVQQRVSQEGGEIDSHTAQVLCAYVENDLYSLHQEIQKLVAYANGKRPITEADIELLTPQAHQANIFHMVDAMGRRDGKAASRIYHQLLAMGSHPLALLGMISRQFRLMIQVKELSSTLSTPQAIAHELKQNPYPISKILAQSANYSMEQLRQIYRRLLEADVDIKTGRIEPILALDMLIAGLSRVP